jgi:hypothetical protein
MPVTDGFVMTNSMVKFVNHGSSAERFNIVLLGEGYRVDEIAKFEADADHFVARLQATTPFDERWSALNIYRVNVVSTDSLADQTPNPNTYFRATLHASRLITLDQENAQGKSGVALAHEIADSRVQNSAGQPVWHVIVLIVNSPLYHGAGGGDIAVYATAENSMTDGADIGIHELAHTIPFGLTDEYYVNENGSTYNAADPRDEPNVALTVADAVAKWGALINTGVLPTAKNCLANNENAPASSVEPNTVGAFEGAFHHACGLYRPQATCRMRHPSQPFCAVCQRRIRETLAYYDSG